MNNQTRTTSGTRRNSAVVAVVCTLLMALIGTGCVKNDEALRLAKAVNDARQKNRLAPLVFDMRLVEKAQSWADEMARSGNVRHSVLSKDVGTGWVRLAENVGQAASVEEAHELTMASPSHRAAVLGGGYTRLGVGVTVVGNKYYFVEVFGS